MLQNVPWQHWAVIGEIWFSLVLLSRYIDQGKMRYSWVRAAWIPWDLAFFGLFLWGCADAGLNWAGAIFLALQSYGFYAMARNIRAQTEYTWETEEVKTRAVNGSIILGAALSLLVVLST